MPPIRSNTPLASAAMRPVRRFEVRPTIPEALTALPGLATNLHWAWDREAVRLFERIWPGWTAGDAHPAHMLRTTSSERLAALAEDQAIVRDLAAANGRLEAAISGPTWFAGRREADDDKAASPLATVAYFSPEFGVTEALPQYSGGLGVLSGDHLKACSDLGVPLVGIGLLYTEGYFHQELDANGWQQEHRLNMDPESLGLTDTGVRVSVDLAGDDVTIRVWREDVGNIALYLLDTDVEGNSRGRHRGHRPALRRRLASPPAPGDRPRHRRRARAAGARHRPAGLPQQRGPRSLPQLRAHP